MKIYIIWLIGVVIWNFGYPAAKPIEDVLAAVVLSLISVGLKKYLKFWTICQKSIYFDNKL